MADRGNTGIVFDFNRTLFDPTVYGLYHGVSPMLDELSARKRLFLYSRKSWDRSDLLKSLGIDTYFEDVLFVEQKTAKNLGEFLAKNGISAAGSIVVGDMLSDELCVGSELGLTTVWMSQPLTEAQILGGTPPCVPDHVVHSIEELRELLASI